MNAMTCKYAFPKERINYDAIENLTNKKSQAVNNDAMEITSIMDNPINSKEETLADTMRDRFKNLHKINNIQPDSWRSV